MLCRFVEILIIGCYIISFGVAYQNSIVANAVMILHPREDFETSDIWGKLTVILTLASVVLQLLFRTCVYFNITNNSSNLISLKSAILIFLAIFFVILPASMKADQHLMLVIGNIRYILKYCILPLIIIDGNEEAKNFFKLHNPKVLNAITTFIQLFSILQDEFLQFIFFVKNKICIPSNQVVPADVLELQDVV